MSAIDTSPGPTLAAPRAPQGGTNLRKSLREMRENALTAHGPENFSADIIAQRILWRRMFILNEPGAIRYVLLDNAANYTKSEVGRRLLEPGLGRGLLTSEGETWRRHRRIMAPSFDPRSVAGYAPDFVRGSALAGWSLPADVKITQAPQVLSALRRASSGEPVAVLLDATQTTALASLPFAADLQNVTQSAPLPSAILAVVNGRLPKARADTLRAALLNLGKSPDGADALANLRLQGFVMPELPAHAARP